ncbi:MAG: GIY-YIG nuclease family protein [Phenylobacterium sp.]|uniref:GIY-YIG nuclease family protein n=1 Tax=Phenylobacterium sp. TaxID=1871053 RepID=UPI003016547F
MSKPRAINIFLNDGDPEGLRSAQISLSTILAIGFRKLQLKAARTAFPELERPGVYILTGEDVNNPDQRVAYIGESEGVAGRLQYHATGKDQFGLKMGFWSNTFVIVSKDENLTKSHARYIEARLISEAKANPAWQLENTQKASEVGKLPFADKVIMDEFIDQLKVLVGVLGCDLFKVVTGPIVAATAKGVSGLGSSAAPAIFGYSGKGFSGQLVVVGSGKMALKAGSIARNVVAPSLSKGVLKLREDNLKSGALLPEAEGLRIATDITFLSPSAAGAALSGMSVNGRTAWKLPSGQTFADWEAAQSIAPSAPDSEEAEEG